jgi:hypothetical protein
MEGFILWKHVLTLLLIISCVGLIILGHIHWQQKVHHSVQQAMTESTHSMHEEVAEGKESQLMKYAAHLPKEVQEKIKKAIHTNHPVRLVIVGSEATSSSADGWPHLLKKQLESTYGSRVFSVTVKEYKGMTTKTAIESNIDQEIIDLRPDILLFEPFILNNNGVIEINDTLEEITTILTSIKSSLPNVTIMLQPPHPIYDAKYYPLQVDELKKFAKENRYIYLDHWSQWPDYRSVEIKKYLDVTNSLPNKNGHRVWANFLIHYFIAKK